LGTLRIVYIIIVNYICRVKGIIWFYNKLDSWKNCFNFF